MPKSVGELWLSAFRACLEALETAPIDSAAAAQNLVRMSAPEVMAALDTAEEQEENAKDGSDY